MDKTTMLQWGCGLCWLIRLCRRNRVTCHLSAPVLVAILTGAVVSAVVEDVRVAQLTSIRYHCNKINVLFLNSSFGEEKY